ncbi:MAG: hypothetical protein PHI34_14420 [Acidobacteriota bacterium]|nr:hypothetical protein [Acidobacteriota bacterium]
MKKAAFFVLIISTLAASCGGQGKIDRIRENGVEVVLNHLEPYKVPHQPSTFDLRPVMAIDTENEALAKAGMGEAGEFGVDGQGNITIVAFKNQKNFIYRFDAQGRLIGSFGRYGQGPGEIEWPFLDRVFDDGRIALTDRMSKYIVFNPNGNAVQEFRPGTSISYLFPLDDDRFVIQKTAHHKRMSQGVAYQMVLCLSRSDFSEIRELDHKPTTTEEGKARFAGFFFWRVASRHIYIANQDRGYEILDYDLEGNLRRKIRKEYRPVAPTREIKESVLGPNVDQPGITDYFPNPLPPIAALFADDEGRLFVMTYETGDQPGAFLWDIFSSDGVFIGRKSLDIFWMGLHYGSKYATMKNGLFYAYQEKENGFRKFVVQRIIWK